MIPGLDVRTTASVTRGAKTNRITRVTKSSVSPYWIGLHAAAEILGLSPSYVATCLDSVLYPVRTEDGRRRYDPIVVDRVAAERKATPPRRGRTSRDGSGPARVTIAVTRKERELLDAHAGLRGMNRSELIRKLIQEHLG